MMNEIKLSEIEENMINELLKSEGNISLLYKFFKEAQEVKWFPFLIDKNIFNPEQIFLYQDNHNLFFTPLLYLKRVSEKTDDYSNDILHIINKIVQYSKIEKTIDNPHIWSTCLEIINNIENNDIISYFEKNKEICFAVWLAEMCKKHDYLVILEIGEKLLGKFLESSKTIDYAEIIIFDYLLDFEVNEKKFFLKGKTAVFLCTEYLIKSSFEKNIVKIAQNAPAFILKIADRLNDLLNYEYGTDSVDIGNYQVLIEKKSKDKPSDGFFQNQYLITLNECKSLHKKDDGLDIDKVIRDMYGRDQTEIKKIEIEASSESEFVDKVINDFNDAIPEHVLELFRIDVQKAHYRLSNFDYTDFWCKSIEIGPPDYRNESYAIVANILKDLLFIIVKEKQDEFFCVIKEFLSDKYTFSIFTKFVLFFMDKFWNKKLEKVFKEDFLLKYKRVLYHTWEEELFFLLKNNIGFMEEEIIGILKKIIEKPPTYYKTEEEKLGWKYRWLSALKLDSDLNKQLQDVKRKLNIQEDYDPYLKTGHETVETVTHTSPLSKQEICKMPVKDLISFFHSFEDKGDRILNAFSEEPDKHGLSLAFKDAIKEDPKHFIKEINLFEKAPYYYVCSFINALKNVWNNGEVFSLNYVFSFCIDYIENEDFFSLIKDDNPTHIRFFYELLDWISKASETGAKRTFSKEDFSVIDRLLKTIKSKLKKSDTDPTINNSFVQYSLNTTVGKAIVAILFFSLYKTRVDTKYKEANWGEKFFYSFLENDHLEAYAWFGQFLCNIAYLDEEYAKETIKDFEKLDIFSDEWQAFMEGCSYAGFNYATYKLMEGHYRKAIGFEFMNDYSYTQLIGYTFIGYLRSDQELKNNIVESANNSIFEDLLLKGKSDIWITLSDSLWDISQDTFKNQDKKGYPRIKEKLIKLWKWFYEQQDFLKKQSAENYNKFIGKLSILICLLDDIDDENVNWIKMTIPYIEMNYQESSFIKYLKKFDIKSSLNYVADIYLYFFQNKKTPLYEGEDITAVVRNIFGKSKYDDILYDKAMKICKHYRDRGYYFLEDICREYTRI